MGNTVQPGPPLWLSIPITICGVLAAVGSISLFGLFLIQAELTSPSFATPGGHQVRCVKGRYDVFAPTPATALNEQNVTVSGPGGAAVEVGYVSGDIKIEKGSTTYLAALSFEARVAGTYTVEINTSAGEAIVAPDFNTEGSRHRGWLAAFLVCLAVAIAGLAMVVVALVRRSRLRSALFRPSFPRRAP